jgi:ABC-type antimicrobial peptide transport system permease subunit
MLARVGVLLGLGLGAGVLMTLLLGRAADGVVVLQVRGDGVLIGVLVALLAAIGLLAAFAPIWRAASIDPIKALRTE